MSEIGNTYLTLADLRKRQNSDDEIAQIIEMLAANNPILQDAIALECNDGSAHQTTIRTGLPQATWRMLYQGVQPTKSTTAQVKDTCGYAEAWSEVDRRLVQMSNDEAAFRLSESVAFVEGLSQQMATTLFYGDQSSAPAKFTGLAPRFNTLAGTYGNQVINAAGAGSDNTSVWFVVWGPNTAHLLFPKGTQAGLQREDKGVQTKTNSDGSVYDVVREKFGWDIGMSVRDPRYIARIANIDVSNLQAGSVDLYKFMRKAYYKLQQRRMAGGKAAIYCNRDVMEALDALATNAGSTDNFVRLTRREIEGEEVLSYRGIPVRETDALLNTEAVVS